MTDLSSLTKSDSCAVVPSKPVASCRTPADKSIYWCSDPVVLVAVWTAIPMKVLSWFKSANSVKRVQVSHTPDLKNIGWWWVHKYSIGGCSIRTYKCTDRSQELGLHGLFFCEATSYQNRIVGYLMRDLMRKTGKRCSCANHRRSVERCRHPAKMDINASLH